MALPRCKTLGLLHVFEVSKVAELRVRLASRNFYTSPRSSLLTVLQYQTSFYIPTKASGTKPMWRRERDVRTKTKYWYDIYMSLVVFVRLKIGLRSRDAVLPSKFRTRLNHVLSPYTCPTYTSKGRSLNNDVCD